MARLPALTLLVLGLTAAACGSDPDAPYPAEVVKNFLASCEVKGTKVGCECAIDKIQRAFTLAQFQAFETRMAKGEVPAELMNAIADCPAS